MNDTVYEDTGSVRDMMERLARPFPSRAISWRVGSTSERDGKWFGLPLSFIDARDVADRLDEVCGIDGWQCSYPTVASGGMTICRIGVRVAGEWLWKEDGAGATDVEAEKGTLSDAFKRAAVRFGIGRYLYGLKTEWIELEVKGKYKNIPKAAFKDLDLMHEKAITAMEWGDREDRNTVRCLTAALSYLDSNSLEDFEKAHEGTIALLPVAAREHLRSHIERLGKAAAATENVGSAKPSKTAIKSLDELAANADGWKE